MKLLTFLTILTLSACATYKKSKPPTLPQAIATTTADQLMTPPPAPIDAGSTQTVNR